MLVLTRRKDEQIMIGDDICVTVLEIRRGDHHPKMVLGIDAPKDVKVFRREVWEEIQRDKESNTKGNRDAVDS